MPKRPLDHLTNDELTRGLHSLVESSRSRLAMILADLAEIDRRRLYLDLGYPTMHAFCVEQVRHPEYEPEDLLEAARLAQRIPGILPAIADGRLPFEWISELAPRLTAENLEESIRLRRGRESGIETRPAGPEGSPPDPPSPRR
jgi:hypothetical protein